MILFIIWIICASHFVVANEFAFGYNNSIRNLTKLKVIQNLVHEEYKMKPYFTKPDSLVNITVKPIGNMVRFECNVIGHPEPNLTWTTNNKIIKQRVKYYKFSLILVDLIPSDSGYYKCNACNDHGCIEHSTKLYVIDRFRKPYIKEGFPKNLTVLLKNTAEIQCPIISDLAAHIVWLKFYLELDNDDNIPDSVKLKMNSENNEILIIKNVTLEDDGWYTCVAENSLGRSIASAYLTVITEFPNDLIKVPKHSLSEWSLILFITVGSSFIIAISLYIYVITKKNQIVKNQKIDRVMKKIIVVKTNDSTSFPIIKIEEHRSVVLQDSNYEQSFKSDYIFPIDKDWEIPRSKLILGRSLGEGEFGRVLMAEACNLYKPDNKTFVAVKMLKDGHTDQDVSDLLSEMELMKMIGKHENIINLLGCCTQNGPLYVVVEYVPHGNLRDFLRTNNYNNSDPKKEKKCFTEKELVSYAFQAARGMEFLASRKCVHRDLAARNVLVGEDYIIKIADFGLARNIKTKDYYRKNTEGRLPVKWMAPESLIYQIYDTKSDVWSYGILLWEIMSLGATPYPYMTNYTEWLTSLQNGYRMEKPTYCSTKIYTVMRECWSFQPEQRPNFMEIVYNVDQILRRASDKEYCDLA